MLGDTVALLAQEATPEIDAGDTAWMLMAASLVLLMTPALALFYGGMSRQKSVLNMMMMSFGAMGVVGVVYLLWGWSMSYGSQDVLGLFANPFELFGLSGVIGDSENWVTSTLGAYPQVVDVAFQLTFAIITVALISGAVAERVRFGTWLSFAGVWVTLVYFPLAHMVWGGGLLSHSASGLAAMIFGTTSDGEGGLTAAVAPVDFAGGTVVHINAGMAALVLVLLIGKRLEFGRTAYRPHNLPLVMLGAALARADEAPGKGWHWGGEAAHPEMPRGDRTYVGTVGSLQEVMWGPGHHSNGASNLMGALKRAMATTGYTDVKGFQKVEVLVAPDARSRRS